MLCGVTGATGFLGSHLVDRLLADGHQVRALVRKSSNLKWLEGKPLTLVQGDLDDPASLRETFADARLVFHVAGVTNANSRDDFFEGNSEGARLAAEAALEASPGLQRFVLVSSQSVVGPLPVGSPMTEETPCQPINRYGASKLAGEQHVRAVSPALPYSIVRPGPIYGPRDTQTLTLFKLAARGLYIKLGLGRRDANFCHAADVVSGLLLAATRPEALGQTFFISDTRNYSVEQSGRLFTQALRGRPGFPLLLPISAAYALGSVNGLVALVRGVRPELNLDRIRMLTARGWAMDTSKIQNLLGYVPRYDLKDGTVQAVQWYREQGWM